MPQVPPLPPLPPLPQPLQAAVGLAAEAAEQARRLPERAVELPMRAVSTLLQLSMRAQQHYAMLAAKGEAILNQHPVTDEPPPWVTFDDPVDGPVDDGDDDDAAGADQDDPTADRDGPALPRPSRFDLVDGDAD